MWCLLHLFSSVEWKYQLCCQISEHTQGVNVHQCHTYLHNVFLCDRGDIKWSAIFMHYDKHTHSCYKGQIIGWNWVPAQGRAKYEVDIFIAKGCNDVFVCLWENPGSCHNSLMQFLKLMLPITLNAVLKLTLSIMYNAILKLMLPIVSTQLPESSLFP